MNSNYAWQRLGEASYKQDVVIQLDGVELEIDRIDISGEKVLIIPKARETSNADSTERGSVNSNTKDNSQGGGKPAYGEKRTSTKAK